MTDDRELAASFDKAVSQIVKSFRSGFRLYIAGNGGSAADAQHLAAEFVSKLAKPRDPLPAEALSTDTSVLTAIGNDYGFEQLFSRQLRAKFRKGDIFLGITTSGNSPNILEALKFVQSCDGYSILLSGRTGGKAKDLANTSILAPSDVTASIQEAHLVLYHSLCQAVEQELFP
jgi:D-sedoheptulose 7-phosphate isomerase